MAIEIKCNCGLNYRLDDSRAGETFKCRLCGAEIHLPAGVGRASPNSPLSRAQTKNSKLGEQADSDLSESSQTIDWSNFSQPGLGKSDSKEDSSSAAPAKASPPVRTGKKMPEEQAMDEPAPAAPPMGWWCVRGVMWLICISFIFAPWLRLSLYNPQSAQRENEHITGWIMASSVVEEMRYTGSVHPAAAAPILENYASDESTARDETLVTVGGRMMALGAAIFLAGIISVPICAGLVFLAGPRAMALPFAVCFLSLSSFTAGWFTAISAVPMQNLLDNMQAQGCYMGISYSVYLMLPVLAILSLRAGIKPDYKLLQAIKWSRQHSEDLS